MNHLLPLLVLAFTQCRSPKPQRAFLDTSYEVHYISSGDNFPEISMSEQHRLQFLAGLHNGFAPEEIQKALGWTPEMLQEEQELLLASNYLKRVGDQVYPSIHIVMQAEGKELFEHARPVAKKIARSIIQMEPSIQESFHQMEVSKSASYDDFRFFLLSNVLLDNWQIEQLEKGFLNKERPLRHGKRYYMQIAEIDPNYPREVFGIYGNQYQCGDGFCYLSYGNNRARQKASLTELSQMDIPFLSLDDQNILVEMARSFEPTLLALLFEHKNDFMDFYQQSVFRNELTFEEFFIWYYHFLYTEATNNLAQEHVIKIPENGIFRVKLEQGR